MVMGGWVPGWVGAQGWQPSSHQETQQRALGFCTGIFRLSECLPPGESTVPQGKHGEKGQLLVNVLGV